jgi:dihydrolipoamide dehydrogenase
LEVYDLIIVGGGPGGYMTAIEAATKYGMHTALIEEKELGGTCLNRGCIPTKTLLHTSTLFADLKNQADSVGLKGTDKVTYDMEAIWARKEEVSETLRKGIELSLKKAKVSVFKGRAELISGHKVRIHGGDKRELEGERIILATGMKPSVPPIKGACLKGVLTSNELLDNKEKLDSLIIIGGGVIGMEFCSVYNDLGVRVVVIEALDRILGPMDKEIGRSLNMQMKKRGVSIHTRAKVEEIRENQDSEKEGLTVVFEAKGKILEESADRVLLATGRRPNVDSLIAEDGEDELKDIEKDERGYIKVNERFETGLPSVYAIGDVKGGIELAHVATAEGRLALEYMNGKKPSIDLDNIPSVVYTSPEIAIVGLDPDKAKEAGIEVTIVKYPMGQNGKTVLSMQDRSFIRLVFDKDEERILGAQLMCANASDMIGGFVSAIGKKMTRSDIEEIVFPHPSYAEAIGEAVRML